VGQSLAQSLGIFLIPQLALSVLVFGVIFAYGIALMGGRRKGLADRPWRRTLDPLGAIAVSIGLLGSVVSFVNAFNGFSGGIDSERIVRGLGTAYTTTGVGLITSIIAMVGAYCLDLALGGAVVERAEHAAAY